MFKTKNAFTLIELLVVIAIIALLSTFSIISLNGARAGARDARRLSDIKQMQTALELYYANVGSYPTQDIIASGTISDGVITYMKTVPTPPTPADNGCGSSNNYSYSSIDSGASYTLSFCIGKTIANGPTGATTTIATPLGMISGGSGGGGGEGGGGFTCGDILNDDREPVRSTYPTVLIGSQCWLAKNLAYLPSVSPSATGNNTNPYYYVYDYQGTSVAAAMANANYTTYGVLYSNAAALTACPSGWHLPLHDEFTILERAICTSDTCATDFPYDTTTQNWQGTNEGGKLKETGTTHWWYPNTGATNSSSFLALAVGVRSTSGSFVDQGAYAYFWSSSVSGSTAWRRYLHSGRATVFRDLSGRGNGFSVRCLKD